MNGHRALLLVASSKTMEHRLRPTFASKNDGARFEMFTRY